MKIRGLKESEVECRIAQIKKEGVVLFLYKDARVDIKILNESVGEMGWQRKHEILNGNIYCSVGIWDEEKKEWLWRQDVGSKENGDDTAKSSASDSFKRACFNWGIGIELYTTPLIWIKAQDTTIIEQGNGGKLQCKDKFVVEKIKSRDGEIVELIIKSGYSGKQVYKYKKKDEIKDE